VTTNATAERVATNDATFRDANEKIVPAARETEMERVPFICECADLGCTEIVRLGLDEYAEIRANSRWFLSTPGHEGDAADHARVVRHGEGYVVVEKVGRAGEVAEELDARAGQP
jgi:hypothetical protein